MKTYLECIPCFMSQTLRTARFCGLEDSEVKLLLNEVGKSIENIPLESSPPATARIFYNRIREMTDVEDPYREIKALNIREAEAMVPGMTDIISRSEDRLLTAVRIATAGNIMDFGVGGNFDLEKDVDFILTQEYGVFHYREFREALEKADSVLYLGDNSGESVFDRLLIQELGKPVKYAVREIPVINDVTMDEARSSGLFDVADVISSGTTAPAVIPELCSPEFMDLFNNADMIISKGQGNYEGLSGTDRPIFFLLKAKCSVIARDLGVNLGDIILASAEKLNKGLL